MFPYIFLALLIPFHWALYKLFPLVGQAGWKGLIPFYNTFIIQKHISKKPWWWVLFLILPGTNLIMFGCICFNLARSFGKYKSSELFMAVVGFFYFFPKLAMDKDTKYVKKEDRPIRKKSQLVEWGEALVFAMIAATFLKGYLFEPYLIPTSSMEQDLMVGDFVVVSKNHYGLKIPQTPLTVPFTHNNIFDLPGPIWPFVKSYSTAWKIPYMRLPGFETIDRNEIVVFNFPANDTTIQTKELHAHNYYVVVAQTARSLYEQDGRRGPWEFYMSEARRSVLKKMPIVTHPVDKRANYIKRCVAISGDKVEFKMSELYINDVKQERPKNAQYSYSIRFKQNLSQDQLYKYWQMEISPEDMGVQQGEPIKINVLAGQVVEWKLSQTQYDFIKASGLVDSIAPNITPKGAWSESIYPNHPKFAWNMDNFGPLVVPKKGMTITLTDSTYILYKRVIEGYELHTCDFKNGKAIIDGKETTSYTFEQDYYFMVGDNRHGSADGRCWGFVPEDHVLGKAVMVLASTNTTGALKFKDRFRWNRFFKLVH